MVADAPINGFDAVKPGSGVAVSALLDGDEEKYAYVVAKSNPVLTDTLNKSLKRVRDRGLLRKVIVRYVGAVAAGKG